MGDCRHVVTDPSATPDRHRVLVVDDEVAVARSLRRILRHHDVEVVHDGARALDVIASDPSFDVILCDLMMPNVTGMQMHAQLSTEHPRLARRMIFMTGGTFSDEAAAFLASIGDVYISKPFDIQHVRQMVQDVLARTD